MRDFSLSSERLVGVGYGRATDHEFVVMSVFRQFFRDCDLV